MYKNENKYIKKKHLICAYINILQFYHPLFSVLKCTGVLPVPLPTVRSLPVGAVFMLPEFQSKSSGP